jgi:hypothetical protein
MPILPEGQRAQNLRQVVASSAVIRQAGAAPPAPGFTQRSVPTISLGVATAKNKTQVSHTNKPMQPDTQLDRVRTALQLTQSVRVP